MYNKENEEKAIAKIKASLSNARSSSKERLTHYIEAGKELAAMKKHCAPGTFGTLCANKLHLSHTSVANYMAVFAKRAVISTRLQELRRTTGVKDRHRTLKFAQQVISEGTSDNAEHVASAPRQSAFSEIERLEINSFRERPDRETLYQFRRLIERFRQHPSSRMAEEIAAIAHDHGWLLQDFAVAAHIDPRLISQLVAQYSVAIKPRRLQSSH